VRSELVEEPLNLERVDDVMAPRRLRPTVLWLAALLVFGLFGYVIWLAYVEGLGGFGGEPPLIKAATEPYKHAPDDPGGLKVANEAASVIDVFRPAPDNPVAPPPLPPPEPAPDPSDLAPRLEAGPDVPDPASIPPLADGTVAVEELPAVPPAPSEQAALDTGADEDEGALDTIPGRWIPMPKPVQGRPPPPPAVAADPPSVSVAEPPPPATVPAAPPPRAPPPEPPRRVTAEPPTTARTPPPPAQSRPTPAREVAALPRPLAPAPQRPATPPPQRASSYRLQLLALRSQNAMDQAWMQLRRRYPGVLDELTPSVERIATVSGTLYRLQAGPFSRREDAASACSAIQARGGQCFVVSATP
jgi:hypothetical protein